MIAVFCFEHFGFFKFNLMNKSFFDKGWINGHSKLKVFKFFWLVVNLRNHTSLFLKFFLPLLRLWYGHLAVSASVCVRHWKVITRPKINSKVLNLLYMIADRSYSMIESVLLAWCRQCICSRVPSDLKLMEGRLNIWISSCKDIIHNFCHFLLSFTVKNARKTNCREYRNICSITYSRCMYVNCFIFLRLQNGK